jgi:hypothetical protein
VYSVHVLSVSEGSYVYTMCLVFIKRFKVYLLHHCTENWLFVYSITKSTLASRAQSSFPGDKLCIVIPNCDTVISISNIWGHTSLKMSTPQTNKQNSMALSLGANYTDWAIANCRRNLVPTFVDGGVSRGQHVGSPTVVILSFIDRSRYFSFK